MIRVGRLLAAGAAALLAVAPVLPADATPHPRAGEWWFSAWGIEGDVWPQTKGKGVTVGVLDTGVNASLPELSGAVLKGGDSANGATDGRKDLDDREGGHGTSMAALIAGQGGGKTGYVGIAPAAKILPIHDSSKLGDKNGLFESFAVGIRFAVDHGAGVVNISQGVTSETMSHHCDSGVQDAIGYALDHDVIVVASAGNTGNTSNWMEMPASCAGVLAVGAIGPNLRPWSGTQRQPYVDVAAPGDGIPALGKHGELFPNGWGTSAAAALTSAAVALVRSRNPRMPARTVVQRLIATARRLGKARWDDRTGYGAIQITAAMNPERYPVPANAPNPVYAAFDKWRASQRGAPVATTREPGRSSSLRSRSAAGGDTLPFVLGAVAVLVIATVVIVGISRRRRSRPGLNHRPTPNERPNQ